MKQQSKWRMSISEAKKKEKNIRKNNYKYMYIKDRKIKNNKILIINEWQNHQVTKKKKRVYFETI